MRHAPPPPPPPPPHLLTTYCSASAGDGPVPDRPRGARRLARRAAGGGGAGRRGALAPRRRGCTDARLRLFQRCLLPRADALLAALRLRWPGVAWAGSVGVGVSAGGVEYFDEPALALMLATCRATSTEVFSGVPPLRRAERLQRAGPRRPGDGRPQRADRRDGERTDTGYLFGGLSSAASARCSSRSAATATSAATARRRRVLGRPVGRGVRRRRARWCRA